jgi:hypothetical protein
LFEEDTFYKLQILAFVRVLFSLKTLGYLHVVEIVCLSAKETHCFFQTVCIKLGPVWFGFDKNLQLIDCEYSG